MIQQKYDDLSTNKQKKNNINLLKSRKWLIVEMLMLCYGEEKTDFL